MSYKDYKMILDTDIGDDIDDAFALGLAIKTSCDLIAVTTVYKNTVSRAKQAKELLSIASKDIPVYAGECYPINGVITPFEKDTGDLATINPCQYDENMSHYEIKENAVDAIIKYAKEYSGRLVIVAVGPLTNIAKAILKEPTIVNDIHAVYCMGGCFSFTSPEWNVLCDAKATDIVYSSLSNFYSVGFDITTKCPLDGDLLVDLRNSNDLITKKIFTWFDRWMNYFNFEKSVMHDPLALSSFINPDIIEYSKMYCKVVIDGPSNGAILTSSEPLEGYHLINVATNVNKNEFFKIIKENYK